MTQFVEANNAVFRYEHVGNAEGAGAPLLLVHELGGDMTSWDPRPCSWPLRQSPSHALRLAGGWYVRENPGAFRY